MKIQFRPLDGIAEGYFPKFDNPALQKQFPGIETWRNGEIKDIPYNLKFHRTFNGLFESGYVVDELLQNRAFIRVDKGFNPNFVCSKCGEEAVNDYIRHEKSGQAIPVEIHGKRVCLNCFNSTPHKVTPTGYVFSKG